jgi:hypothetical protein
MSMCFSPSPPVSDVGTDHMRAAANVKPVAAWLEVVGIESPRIQVLDRKESHA